MEPVLLRQHQSRNSHLSQSRNQIYLRATVSDRSLPQLDRFSPLRDGRRSSASVRLQLATVPYETVRDRITY